MVYVMSLIAALAGALIQSVTGFGAAVIIMLVLPAYLGMAVAPSVSCCLCMLLNVLLAWQYRHSINWKLVLWPALMNSVVSGGIIFLVGGMDLKTLSILFGCFLMLLAAYFLFVSKRARVRPTAPVAALCGAVAGVTGGLFSIGGPTLALYFVAATEDHASYIGTMNMVFTICNVVVISSRVCNGLLPASLLPVIGVGLLGVLAGQKLGSLVGRHMNPEFLRKAVYIFVGVSGVVTVLQNLL